METDHRLSLLTDWVRGIGGLAVAELTPASRDASFRRYFRVTAAQTYIAMDAPPPQEDCRPFVTVAGFLGEMGLNSPRVLEADLEQGFLLLTDLGSRQYLAELDANPVNAERLYRDAIDALLRIQRQGVRYQSELPPYDEQLLRFELSLFHDWLCERHLGIELSASDQAQWGQCCDVLVENALVQPQVFVHRDYHSRNLMVTAEDNPGILDFQDAVCGPYTYDLVSLLKDCYIKWPTATINERAAYFRRNTHLAGIDSRDFTRDFELMGVRRQLKAAGIFARLMHRDGKHGYLADVPRTLGYIMDIATNYEELSFLGDLVGTRVLPALEANT